MLKAFPIGFLSIGIFILAFFNEIITCSAKFLVVEKIDFSESDVEDIENLTWSDVYLKPKNITTLLKKNTENSSAYLIPLCYLVGTPLWTFFILWYFHDTLWLQDSGANDISFKEAYISRFDDFIFYTKYYLLAANLFFVSWIEESEIVANKGKSFLETQLLTSGRAIRELSQNMFKFDKFIAYCKFFGANKIGVREEKHQLRLTSMGRLNSPIDWLWQVNKGSVVDFEVAEEAARDATNSYKFWIISSSLMLNYQLAFYLQFSFTWILIFKSEFLPILILTLVSGLGMYLGSALSSIWLRMLVPKVTILGTLAIQLLVIVQLPFSYNKIVMLGINFLCMFTCGVALNLRSTIMPKLYGMDVGMRLNATMSFMDLLNTLCLMLTIVIYFRVT